ncbi:hypothetical protein DFH09DRAFT_1128175 [Mycena vulgaris]|nr:hypothetical protein DFH09DRAFT_1128175 [Mycena vulgaris]
MLSFLSLLLVPAVLAHNSSLPGLLRKRGGMRFSNYDTEENVGACGSFNHNSEYVVALTAQMWNNGANCYKDVYITYNGMSATAKIVDECMGCPYNGLDFSQSLFGHFVGGEQNNLEVGIIYGDWVYGTGPSSGGGGGGGNDDGNDDDTTTTTTKKPITTTMKKPITTTTSSTTTTTQAKSSTTSHTTTSSTTTSKSSVPASSFKTSATAVTSATSASASASAAPTPTATPGPQNLEEFSQVLLSLAGLVAQAPHAA